MQDELPIVQISSIADYLLGMLRNYRVKFKNSLLDVNITFEDACDIVRAMVEQNITERLYWVPVPTDASKEIARVFAGYNDVDHEKRAKSLKVHVFNEVEALVESAIERIMGCERTWYMWTTKRIGHDLWLEPGVDFRIHEWENAVREKRLDYPSYVSDALNEEINEVLLRDEVASRERLSDMELQRHLTACRNVTDLDARRKSYIERNIIRRFVTAPAGNLRVL